MPENVILLQVQGSGTETMCLSTVTERVAARYYQNLLPYIVSPPGSPTASTPAEFCPADQRPPERTINCLGTTSVSCRRNNYWERYQCPI